MDGEELVGASVGALDGEELVGASVGALDGAELVGDTVGAVVGAGVGVAVGAKVGATVGAAVGAHELISAQEGLSMKSCSFVLPKAQSESIFEHLLAEREGRRRCGEQRI